MNERDIFLAALRKPPGAERRDYVAEACAGQSELRRHVEGLLEAYEKADQFLESSAPAHAKTVIPPRIAEGPGTVIGPYRLLEQIGEGGFGLVFMAEQLQPVRRKVAIKVIKPGMDSKQVIARFEVERQALALMDHPHIAKVLDAGTTDSGRPYFVMELVRGIPITDFCDQHQLTVQERLELFVTVCQATQHAHQKGVIHRDIKPSNVLVTLHDDRPVVKVIDFGVAKATSGQLTDKTLFTGFMQMLGTPLYMSPEQTALSGVDIDTRSDIYSLGVLLYELLTGTTPFERKRLELAALDEVRRIIREEEPRKPSTRISTLGDSLPTLCAQRRIEPRKLGQLLQGDLDWIIMKALEKDRTRRYETANGFARDVQRYLADELIEARPPSAGYRLRRVVRRNKIMLTTAGLVALALIAGTAVSTLQAIRARRAEDLAQTRLASEEQAHLEAEANLKQARRAVDEYFTTVSQSKLFDVPSLQPLRKELLEGAVRYYQSLLRKRGDDPALLADLAVAHLRLAEIYHEVDRNDDGIAALSSGLDVVERLRREYPDAKQEQRRVAGFWKGLRTQKLNTGMPKDPAKAERTLMKFVDLWEVLARENPSVDAFANDLAAAYSNLANWQASATGASASSTLANAGIDSSYKAIAIWEQLSRSHADMPEYRENLVSVLRELPFRLNAAGRQTEAPAVADRALQMTEKLVTQFPRVPQYRAYLADSLNARGHHLEAAGSTREAADVYHRQFELAKGLVTEFPTVPEYAVLVGRSVKDWFRCSKGIGSNDAVKSLRQEYRPILANLTKFVVDCPDQPQARRDLAECLYDIAAAFDQAGEPALAESMRTQCVELLRRLVVEVPGEPNYQWRLGHACRTLAFMLRSMPNRSTEAERAFEEAEKAFTHLHRQDPKNAENVRFLADTYNNLALLLSSNGRPDEAVKTYRKLLELAPQSAVGHNNLAWLLSTCAEMKLRDPACAVALAKKAVDLEPNQGMWWNTLGVAQYRAGDWNAADVALRRSMKLRAGGDSFDWFFLAMCDWQRGNKDKAGKWCKAACLWMAKNAPKNDEIIRFRSEAAALLGIKDLKGPENIDDAAIATALVDADPDTNAFWCWHTLAKNNMRNGRWTEAKSDALRAANSRPEDEFFQYVLAAILARANDREAYDRQCRKLLARYAETTQLECAERTAKVCLALPTMDDVLGAASRLATRSATESKNHWALPYAHVAAALAAYRRGEFRVSLDWCDTALIKDGNDGWFRSGQTYYIRAMALAHLGKGDEARVPFEKAHAILQKMLTTANANKGDFAWQDLAICELLDQEAEQTLKAPPKQASNP